jgi:hypothetical protein
MSINIHLNGLSDETDWALDKNTCTAWVAAEIFYATLAYIRHFISAGCYDNDPWYLVTNLRGIQILRGFIFLNAPLILNAPLNLLLGTSYRPAFSSCDGRMVES